MALSPASSDNDELEPVEVEVDEGEIEVDETALAISVMGAQAAAELAAADGSAQAAAVPRPPYRKRTDTWERRGPSARPDLVVFEGSSLRELQSLVSSCRAPTIIDLMGRSITLSPHDDGPGCPPPAPHAGQGTRASGAESAGAAPSGTAAGRGAAQSQPSAERADEGEGAGEEVRRAGSTGGMHVPGWSPVTMAGQRNVARRSTPTAQTQAQAQAEPSPRRPSPARPRQATSGGGGGPGAAPGQAAAGLKQLTMDRDDVALVNGTLQLAAGCQVVVRGQRVALRGVEVIDAEAAGWWRQANALPGTLQPALLAVARAASLQLDDCLLAAGGRDVDLLRAEGGAEVTARYCRLQGGANAVAATLRARVHLDCCVLEGYSSTAVIAMDAFVRAVGSRLLGAEGALVGLQAVSSATVAAVGCFLRGHLTNVECMGGSSVDLQGCVLSRSQCRHGLTLHPGTPAGRVQLADCELGHAVQVGGGQLDMERCVWVLGQPAAGSTDADAPPPDARGMRVQLSSAPDLAAKLAAALAALGDTAGPYGGCVDAGGAMRLVACRAGGSEEAVWVEAAEAARVHVSGSPSVSVRRAGRRQ